ncbi:IS1595 transposase, partial [mine drainage metagenome]
NFVQFQQELPMLEFMQQYGTEAKAYRALCQVRWLQGFRCGDRRRSRLRRGRQVYYQQCRSCRHQTTLRRCTIFDAIKPVRGFDDASIKAWPAHHLAPGTEAYTDGLFCFRRLAKANHAHTTNGSSQGIVLVTDGDRAGCGIQGARSRWINVLLGNVKRAISRSY